MCIVANVTSGGIVADKKIESVSKGTCVFSVSRSASAKDVVNTYRGHWVGFDLDTSDAPSEADVLLCSSAL